MTLCRLRGGRERLCTVGLLSRRMRQRLDDGVERLRQDGHLRRRIRTWKVSELGGQIKEGHLSFWGGGLWGGVYKRSLNFKPFSGAGVEEWVRAAGRGPVEGPAGGVATGGACTVCAAVNANRPWQALN